MGVRDPRYYLKVLYGCKRPAISSIKFYVGVRDPQREPKSSVAQRRHTVMIITYTSSGVIGIGISFLVALALGTGEPVRPQYMCVIGTTSDWFSHLAFQV